MEKLTCILCIVNILGLTLTITTIILANNIGEETIDNPLEEYEKRIVNMFDDDDETDKTENSITVDTNIISNELSKLNKYCQCGEKILDNICTEEQIASGCNDVSKNNKKNILRHLGVDCNNIEGKIVTEGGFSKAFDLKYDMVYKMSSGIFIVLIILAFFVFAIILLTICNERECVVVIVYIILGIYILSLPTNFILFMIMIVSYYKGDAGEFLDFYEDCLKGEQKIMDLQNTYEKMNKISKYMIAFLVINFFHITLHIVEAIIICKKMKKRKKGKE